MKKKQLKEFQELLEKEEKGLGEKLKNLISEDKELSIKMPDFGSDGDDTGIEADQIEEIGNLLSLRQILEKDLYNVQEALEKIKKGNYGICQSCQKEIELKRLRIEPAATLCIKCLRKKK